MFYMLAFSLSKPFTISSSLLLFFTYQRLKEPNFDQDVHEEKSLHAPTPEASFFKNQDSDLLNLVMATTRSSV
ncbi:hypothetical protein HanRHA438_Chr16g0761291 [Helianthus annuus]|nr:hypothetical protein HanIR_Chr16g0814551 [Helianthus annuus]KAJ0835959.1 hypothetical protein HanRHA438_Chr16g0761291 [Helianthus annuus]